MPISPHIPRCQYIRTDGRRCGSPALKTKRWCYFHYEVNRKTVTLDVPPLEDGNAVQLALTDLARAVADDRIPLKNAALLAYILQTASANLKKVQLGVFTDHMITDLPDLDPYSRGLSISDPSAPPQSSVILSDAASASEGPGQPPRKPALSGVEGVRKGRIRSASSPVEGQGFNPAEKDGPTALSSLPKARAQRQRSANSSAPSAVKGSDSLPRKLEAAKTGSLKDARELLDFVQDAS